MNKIIKITTFALIAIFGFTLQANTAFAQTSNVSSCSSATLHGYVSPVGSASTVWFEWSSDSSSVSNGNGNTSGSQTFSTPSYFEKTISGLNESSTYYYRTVSRNDKGTVHGAVASFKTASCGNNDNNNNDDTTLYATTNSASSITDYSARLNGSVSTNGGTVYKWFEYGTNSSNLSQTTDRISSYSSNGIAQTVSGLSSDRTYYFRVVAEGNGRTVYGQVRSFTTRTGYVDNNNDSEPTVTTRSATGITSNTATINGYVDANGGSNTYGWFEWGTTSGNLSHATSKRYQGSSDSSIQSEISGLSANTTYYYRAVTENSNGSNKGSVYNFTTASGSDNNSDTGIPTGVTMLATNVNSSSATLNSLVIQSGSKPTSAWFEWGTSESLGRRTSTKNVGTVSSVRHAEYVNGLINGTTYYFRIVVENDNGRNNGVIRSFVAKNEYVAPVVISKPVVTKPVVVYKPTVVSKPVVKPVVKTVAVPVVRKTVTTVVEHAEGVSSLVMLTIDAEDSTVSTGNGQRYTITWRNNSEEHLRNVVLRVLIPQSLSFESADDGSYSKTDSMHTLLIGDLQAGEEGQIYVVLKGGNTLKSNDLVVTTANIVYTDESDIQGDALAYVTQKVSATGAVLGASAGAASAPIAIIGWLILIILIIILCILIHNLYKRVSEKKD